MDCKFCGSMLLSTEGVCKDRPDIPAFKCQSCSLIQLGDFSHISDETYTSEEYLSDDVQSRFQREAYWNMRRVEKVRDLLPNAGKRRILDFGCGIGGFLKRAAGLNVTGFDLSERLVSMHQSEGYDCVSDLNSVPSGIDTIVLFHVLEHIKQPWAFLKELSGRFPSVDRFVIEVPNTEEALISQFDNEAYRKNHFVSLHLYYFSGITLRNAIERAGLSVLSETQIQRYSLGNTFGWLRDGRGGGQDRWPAFNDYHFHKQYEAALGSKGVADSLFVVASPNGHA